MFSQHLIFKVRNADNPPLCDWFAINTHTGQEYDMLYISTCETTDVNGETRNPTKSLCDLYVFNTTITRARSLIVAFGNPYLLLSIEEHMHLNCNGGRCWSQFIKMCLLHNTLIIPDSVVHATLHDQVKRKLMTTIDSLPNTATPSHHGKGEFCVDYTLGNKCLQ